MQIEAYVFVKIILTRAEGHIYFLNQSTVLKSMQKFSLHLK